MPRQYSKNEIEKQFIENIWHQIDYWKSLPDADIDEQLEGLAFSILATLDGVNTNLIPRFIVAPLPHADDREFRRERGMNWYPENHRAKAAIACDLGGDLRDRFHDHRPAKWERIRRQASQCTP